MEKRKGESNKLQYVWPKSAVIRLIQLWRENECLYNPKHERYYSRSCRKNALDEMANALREFYPEITSAEVKNKLTYLRGQYDRELCRIKQKNGRMDDDVYVPSVFWYNDMEFLSNFIGGNNLSEAKERRTEQVEDSGDSFRNMGDWDESPFQECKRSRLDNSTPESSLSIIREYPSLLPESSMPLYDQTPINVKEEKKKRHEAFCKYIKAELNGITNKNIKDELIEKIMSAIFGAKKEQRLCKNNLKEGV